MVRLPESRSKGSNPIPALTSFSKTLIHICHSPPRFKWVPGNWWGNSNDRTLKKNRILSKNICTSIYFYFHSHHHHYLQHHHYHHHQHHHHHQHFWGNSFNHPSSPSLSRYQANAYCDSPSSSGDLVSTNS